MKKLGILIILAFVSQIILSQSGETTRINKGVDQTNVTHENATITNNLKYSKNPIVGYYLKCYDSAGNAVWAPVSGGGGSTYTTSNILLVREGLTDTIITQIDSLAGATFITSDTKVYLYKNHSTSISLYNPYLLSINVEDSLISTGDTLFKIPSSHSRNFTITGSGYIRSEYATITCINNSNTFDINTAGSIEFECTSDDHTVFSGSTNVSFNWGGNKVNSDGGSTCVGCSDLIMNFSKVNNSADHMYVDCNVIAYVAQTNLTAGAISYVYYSSIASNYICSNFGSINSTTISKSDGIILYSEGDVISGDFICYEKSKIDTRIFTGDIKSLIGAEFIFDGKFNSGGVIEGGLYYGSLSNPIFKGGTEIVPIIVEAHVSNFSCDVGGAYVLFNNRVDLLSDVDIYGTSIFNTSLYLSNATDITIKASSNVTLFGTIKKLGNGSGIIMENTSSLILGNCNIYDESVVASSSFISITATTTSSINIIGNVTNIKKNDTSWFLACGSGKKTTVYATSSVYSEGEILDVDGTGITWNKFNGNDIFENLTLE